MKQHSVFQSGINQWMGNTLWDLQCAVLNTRAGAHRAVGHTTGIDYSWPPANLASRVGGSLREEAILRQDGTDLPAILAAESRRPSYLLRNPMVGRHLLRDRITEEEFRTAYRHRHNKNSRSHVLDVGSRIPRVMF